MIEEKIGNSLEHIGKEYIVLNKTSVVQILRLVLIKWDHMILKAFSKERSPLIEQNDRVQNGKKNFNNPSFDRGLISEIYKYLKKQDINTLIQIDIGKQIQTEF